MTALTAFAGGATAALLLNRNNETENITAHWCDIGLKPERDWMRVRDLWAHRTVGVSKASYTAEVPAHGCVMVKLTPLSSAERADMDGPDVFDDVGVHSAQFDQRDGKRQANRKILEPPSPSLASRDLETTVEIPLQPVLDTSLEDKQAIAEQ